MIIDDTFLDELWKQEAQFLTLLKSRYASTPKTLWQWQMQVPLSERWTNFVGANREFGEFVARGGDPKRDDLRVLDLGCGFCMYWPALTQLGFRKFVGIDLFDLRVPLQLRGASPIKRALSFFLKRSPRAALRSLLPTAKTEHYLAAAHDFVQHTCPDIEYQLIEGDVGDIDSYDLNFDQFDLICACSVNYAKLGATGIPPSLFNSVVERYSADNCFAVYFG